MQVLRAFEANFFQTGQCPMLEPIGIKRIRGKIKRLSGVLYIGLSEKENTK